MGQQPPLTVPTWSINLAIPLGVKDNIPQPKDPERG